VASSPAKVWHLLPHDQSAIQGLAKSLKVPPILAQLLLNRGQVETSAARRFLNAPLDGLHSPERLPGVAAAAERLLAAVQRGERICVYGDYDADGVTGAAILLRCLRQLGADVDYYLPLRLEEGYGLNREALRQIAAAGSKVVVTVDCGIASVDEALEARRLGLDLLITDHHEMRAELPQAAVLVHPRLPGTDYPFGNLSGSAVAFKLAWALAMRHCGSEKVTPVFRELLLDAIGLAALGVIADVMPLQDENRILVRYGLRRLSDVPPLGLHALLEQSGLTPANGVDATTVGFRIAPRLNAAGRLGCARRVVELLTTADPAQAQELARELDELNQQRQALERQLAREAEEQVEREHWNDAPALVLAGAGWHAGVIGIVASRMVETFGRPTLLVALPERGERIASGSGRSIAGFPLHEALRYCDDLLLSHGGHHAAAGFRLVPDRLDALRERFCEYAERYFPSGPPTPTLRIDAEAPLSVFTVRMVESLRPLEPYGAGNRQPLFLASDLRLAGEPRVVGKDQNHLSFRVCQGGVTLKAIAFKMADRIDELRSAGGACSLVFTPKINDWQGRTSVDLEVVDLQAGPTPTLAMQMPSVGLAAATG
jgi:single-stranded-DNA-specific exonuclease